MIVVETLVIPPLDSPTRLSDLAAGTFQTIHSRKGFKKALKAGLVSCNDETAKTATLVRGGETIVLHKTEEVSKKPTIDIPLRVLYEDNWLAIVQKPAGVEVSGNKKYTIENALPRCLLKSPETDSLQRPLPAHRLDYPTSGALLIAKTSKTLLALHQLFETQKISKTYLAVTINKMEKKGSIEVPVDNKLSVTHFKVIDSVPSHKYESLQLVSLNPQTGRRHQIRKHLKSIGNPILGDKLYGIEGKISKGNGLYLHALRLSFVHPISEKQITVHSKPPKKFYSLFNIEVLENLVFTNPE